jgi:hypothetical protein
MSIYTCAKVGRDRGGAAKSSPELLLLGSSRHGDSVKPVLLAAPEPSEGGNEVEGAARRNELCQLIAIWAAILVVHHKPLMMHD